MWNDFVFNRMKKLLVPGVKMESLYFRTVRGGRFVPGWLGTAQEAFCDWPCLFGQQAVMWRAAAQETDQECGWRSHLASSKDDHEPHCCLLSEKPQTINTDISAGPTRPHRNTLSANCQTIQRRSDQNPNTNDQCQNFWNGSSFSINTHLIRFYPTSVKCFTVFRVCYIFTHLLWIV